MVRTTERILLVEDDVDQRTVVASILTDSGYNVVEAVDVDGALAALATYSFALVLSDWKLADGPDGMSLLASIRDRDLPTAFVMVTAYGSISNAVETIRLGADDYLPKPFERDLLLLTVERVLRAQRLKDENRKLQEALGIRDRLVDMVGRAPSMQRLYRQIEKLADTSATVLIHGESGTGKELVARALHTLSSRKSGPFVAVNCAAIPGDLLEAEFFGAVKGAFTGASADRAGSFASAEGGTLFLDEIADLSLELQPKLLRALELKCIRPVGSNVEREVDVRVIAATHRDLGVEVQASHFREDLRYRLEVVRLDVPPLRERPEDLPALIQHLLELAANTHGKPAPSLSTAVRRRLLTHTWPGNVRELRNTLERVVLLAEGPEARLDDLPQALSLPFSSVGKLPTGLELPSGGVDWDELEHSFIQQAMKRTAGNRAAAARLLGLPYRTFLYRLEKHRVGGRMPGSKDIRPWSDDEDGPRSL